MNVVGNLQKFTFDDFSGGMTDFYVEAPMNQYELADNLLITPNKKLLTRPGSTFQNINFPQSPDGNQRINTLINYDHDSILIHGVGRSLFYVASGWVILKGPTGNKPFNVGDNNSLIASTQWNKHLYLANDSFAQIQKIYRDNAGVLQIRSAGLPRLASDPTITAGASGSGRFVYLFLYRYTYVVDTVTFETFGPTRQVVLENAAPPNSNAVAISNIPVLDNGLHDNWDTDNVVVEIYRTQDGQISFFKVDEVPNGTTTYSDSTADSDLIDNVPVYTAGGVLDNDPPPPCKYVHIANGSCYYANIMEDGENITNRVRQSKANIPDSAPGASFVDVEEEITGISSVRGFVVVLCKKAIYRLDGTFDELGRGSIVYTKINDTAGCVSHKSIVQTVDGIFWAGNDGFYYSDAYRVIKISNGFNNTYKSLVLNDTQKRNIVGTYEELNRRVWWGVQKDGSSLDNDACFILDLRWGISEYSSFTTASGGASFNPTSVVFFDKKFTRGSQHGYIFAHDESILTDPRVDQYANTSDWGVQTIIHTLRMASTNFGDSKNRKWVPRVVTALKNDSNISLSIISNNDDGRQVIPLSPIRFRGNLFWGDASLIWGDDTILWNKIGLIDSLRRFPARSLRCAYKQMILTNAFVNIISSDQLGTVSNTRPPITPVTVNQRYVTLDDSVNFSWDVTDIDYYISFENDGYVNTYVVAAFTPARLTIIDPFGTAPLTSGLKWVLRGYPKGEVLDLLSVTLLYAPTSPSQQNATILASEDGLPA